MGAAVETGFAAGREYPAHTAIPPANRTATASTGTDSEGTDNTVRCARRDFLDLFIGVVLELKSQRACPAS